MAKVPIEILVRRIIPYKQYSGTIRIRDYEARYSLIQSSNNGPINIKILETGAVLSALDKEYKAIINNSIVGCVSDFDKTLKDVEEPAIGKFPLNIMGGVSGEIKDGKAVITSACMNRSMEGLKIKYRCTIKFPKNVYKTIKGNS